MLTLRETAKSELTQQLAVCKCKSLCAISKCRHIEPRVNVLATRCHNGLNCSNKYVSHQSFMDHFK